MRNRTREIGLLVIVLLIFSVTSYAANKIDPNPRLSDQSQSFETLHQLNQPLLGAYGFFDSFGLMMSEYIDQHCSSYNYKMSKNLERLGTTACQNDRNGIRENDIGMASLHALRKMICKSLGAESIRPGKLDKKFPGSDNIDFKLLFTRKDIRPLITCKFDCFDQIHFKAYISPLEGTSHGYIEVPLTRIFHLDIQDKLSFDSGDLCWKNTVFFNFSVSM
jgi:hypothetical protein